MEYRDKALSCAACGQSFTWTAAEQFFYAGRGLCHAPKRCAPCREGRRRGSRRRTSVTCARCGCVATVSFFPNEGRPVYCDGCFGRRSDPA